MCLISVLVMVRLFIFVNKNLQNFFSACLSKCSIEGLSLGPSAKLVD